VIQLSDFVFLFCNCHINVVNEIVIRILDVLIPLLLYALMNYPTLCYYLVLAFVLRFKKSGCFFSCCNFAKGSSILKILSPSHSAVNL